jgi:hypothetical protein
MSSQLGWMLAAIVGELGIDAVQRFLDEKTGTRHSHEGGALVPTQPSSPHYGQCMDPIEVAEFAEMEEAARCGCEED